MPPFRFTRRPVPEFEQKPGSPVQGRVGRGLITRRRFLLALGLGTLAGAVDVAGIEPRRLTVTRSVVPLDRLSGPALRVLHLSDLHASRVVSLDFLAAAVARGLAEHPDVVCLTGDFITRGHRDLDGYAEVLRPLSAAAPAFACLGNHDGGRWAARKGGHPDSAPVREVLHRAGITLLDNAARTISVRGREVRVVGLGDLWAGELRPREAFAGPVPSAAPTLVLVHNPDAREALREMNWDLLLCGHTHGGQVKLPLLGPLVLPIRDRRFAEGQCRWEGRWIYVTRGVGNLWGIRFNCPPEITLLTVTPAREATATRPMRLSRPGHRLARTCLAADTRARAAGV